MTTNIVETITKSFNFESAVFMLIVAFVITAAVAIFNIYTYFAEHSMTVTEARIAAWSSVMPAIISFIAAMVMIACAVAHPYTETTTITESYLPESVVLVPADEIPMA